MSGAKKKWSKRTNKEKREWSCILTAEMFEDIKKKVPASKVITANKLAERYKLSITLARKVLSDLEKEGKIVQLIKSHGLAAYGRPAGAEDVPEQVEEKVEVAAKKSGKGGKK